MTWVVQRLPEGRPPQHRQAPFAPVARVVSHRTFLHDFGQRVTAEEIGSGFLIHPRAAITAAHVATFPAGGGRRAPATGIMFDFGGLRIWGVRMAVPRGYLANANDADDIAVVLLPEDAANMDETFVPVQEPPDEEDVSVWGRSIGNLDPRATRAVRTDRLLEYGLPNMPGHSGGPVATPPSELRRARVIGVHVAYDGRGKAAGIFLASLREALICLDSEPGGT